MHISDLKHPDITLQQKLEYLYSLRTGSKINWDNAAYLNLLEKLGNPHKSVPPVIHVAGTNGKGSVVAMLHSIFEAAGYRVHTYTSPHLIRVNERIVLAGEEISDDALNTAIDEIVPLIGNVQLSFFEIMTALAFKAFARTPADVLLLEVGMGGRLDCTNVIEVPLVSIINRISLDHTEFLGRTIEEIAAQKAGIIKRNVPCAVGYQGDGQQADKVRDILLQEAQKLSSHLSCCDIDWYVKKNNDGFEFTVGNYKTSFPSPALPGDHQIYNAGLVLAALQTVTRYFKIESQHIKAGLSSVFWAGRLQQLAKTQSTHEIWLDCGHNDSAGEILAQQAKHWQEQDNKPFILIVGMLGTKDLETFVFPILPYCTRIYCVGISGEPNSQQAEMIAKKIFGFYPSCAVHPFSDVFLALQDCGQQQGVQSRILIAGSVYLAGEVLRLHASGHI